MQVDMVASSQPRVGINNRLEVDFLTPGGDEPTMSNVIVQLRREPSRSKNGSQPERR